MPFYFLHPKYAPQYYDEGSGDYGDYTGDYSGEPEPEVDPYFALLAAVSETFGAGSGLGSGSRDSYPEPLPEVDPYYGGLMKESSGSMTMDDSSGSGDSIPMVTSYDYEMEESKDYKMLK